MIISRVAANKGLFLFGGCIVGVLVGHVVIRLIYRCELKTILDGKLAGIFSIAAAVLILAGFQFAVPRSLFPSIMEQNAPRW